MTEPSFTEEDREQLRDLADHVDECAWTQDARSIESALAYIEELEARLARAETEDVEALTAWRAELVPLIDTEHGWPDAERFSGLIDRILAALDPAQSPESEAKEPASEGSLAAAKRALQRIAVMPTVERNPDGVDQAAASMQLVAQAALTRAEGRDAG